MKIKRRVRLQLLFLVTQLRNRGNIIEMAKKRKARDQLRRNEVAPSRNNDTFNDSEDEFVAGRERILLDEGPAAKRRRRMEEEDAELMPSDEEVFANQNIPDDPEEDVSEADSEDDASTAAENEAAVEDEDDERYWGANRSDYYGADAIEEEQDALDEEAEARRLQQKQLQSMTEADFGFDELEWAQTGEDQPKQSNSIEKLPPVRIPDDATEEERLEILRSRYPEFEPLAQDLLACHEELEELKTEDLPKSKNVTISTQQTRQRAVSAYMAVIAMYMAVLTSGKDGLSLPPAELRQHPIMNTLLRARQLWDATKDLESDADEDHEVQEQAAEIKTALKPVINGTSYPNGVTAKAITKSDTAVRSAPDIDPSLATKASKTKKTKVSSTAEPTALETFKTSKKASKKSDKPKRATLEELLAQSTAADDDESDFGDEGPLTAEEAAAKASKKKSLRFYTSQIAQKAGKRASASRHAGGDDDLPYKERIRDRQERLQREAAQRNTAPSPGASDDDADYDENDLAAGLNKDSNDYYNSLVSAGKTKKLDKQARAEAHALAAAQGAQVYEEETVGADGKRKITYAIEKNKGLQPRRKKEVRNPRVKKKKKFEEKKKKLASMRPVWKGGQKGTYSGEQSGINARVVKSIKL